MRQHLCYELKRVIMDLKILGHKPRHKHLTLGWFPLEAGVVVPGSPQAVHRIELFLLTCQFVCQHYARQLVAILTNTWNMDTLEK